MESRKDIRILLVDDDPAELELALHALCDNLLATAVRVARGGQEALDYLFGRGAFGDRRKYPLPDLIILDLHMPAVDGYRVLRQLKAAEDLKRIPVVVLCTSDAEGGRALAPEHRAESYLVKPVTPEALCRHVSCGLFSTVEPIALTFANVCSRASLLLSSRSPCRGEDPFGCRASPCGTA
jgi:two-component system response regulator